jgi:hypothetical protein
MNEYELKVRSSLGGRDVNDVDVNIFRYLHAAGAENPVHDDIASDLATQFATILLSDKRILDIVISPLKNDGSGLIETNNYKSVPIDIVGTRPVRAGKLPAIGNYVAVFKRSAANGAAGRLQVRGCFYEDEVKSSANNTPALIPGLSTTPFTTFGANLPTIFANSEAQLVLPGKKVNGVLGPPRIVTKVAFQSVALRDIHTHRRSIEEEKRDVAKREINMVAKEVEREQRNNPLVNIGQLLTKLAPVLLPILKEYGVPFLLNLVKKQLLRDLILAAAALL